MLRQRDLTPLVNQQLVNGWFAETCLQELTPPGVKSGRFPLG